MSGRGTLRAIGLTFGRQVAASACNLAIIILIARTLGPAGAGAFAVALLLPALLTQVLNLGLAPANVYFVASGRARLIRAWCASRNLGFPVILFGLALGSVVIVTASEALLPGLPPHLLWIALACLPFMLTNAILLSLFQARQDFATYNRIFLLQPAVALLAVCALWAADRLTLGTALIATLAGNAAATSGGLVAARAVVPLTARQTGLVRYLREALAYGIKVHVNDNVAFLNRRLDIFVVNLFAGVEAAGLYTVAARVAEQLWLLSTATATVLFPKLSSFGPEDTRRAALTEVMARTVLWITLLAAGVLAAIAEPLLTAIFGAPFAAADLLILILLPGIVVRSVSRILASDFAARGRPGLNLALGAGVLILNLALNLWLVPVYGAAGAAVATSTAYLAMVALRLALQHHLTDLRWWRAIVPLPRDFATLQRLRKPRGGALRS